MEGRKKGGTLSVMFISGGLFLQGTKYGIGWTGSSFLPISYPGPFFEGRIASEKSQVKTSAIDGLGLSFYFCMLPFLLPPFDISALVFLGEQTWLRCQHKYMFVRVCV